jgi:hypothetical protein
MPMVKEKWMFTVALFIAVQKLETTHITGSKKTNVEDSMHIRNRSLKLKIKPRLILCIFYG